MSVSPELVELGERLRNWGRWGDDDQIGTLNLIDADAVRRGAASVRRGARFDLALDLAEDGVQIGQPAGRINAMVTPSSLNERDVMAPGIWEGTDDIVTMSTCAATHIDTLAHVGYGGELYGGRDQHQTVTARAGATALGAETIPPIVTRGILIDVPAIRGVDFLEPGTIVGADDLDRGIEIAGVEVQPGDAICIRTGEVRHYLAGDKVRYATGVDWQNTGLGLSSCEWFHRHDVAAAFLDCYTYEVMPPESGNWDDLLAVHMVQLRDMGMFQGQNWHLEELAADCAADGRFDFMLCVAGEPIVGATSAPAAPIAVK